MISGGTEHKQLYRGVKGHDGQQKPIHSAVKLLSARCCCGGFFLVRCPPECVCRRPLERQRGSTRTNPPCGAQPKVTKHSDAATHTWAAGERQQPGFQGPISDAAAACCRRHGNASARKTAAAWFKGYTILRQARSGRRRAGAEARSCLLL